MTNIISTPAPLSPTGKVGESQHLPLEITLRVPGLPGVYLITDPEDLRDLAADPIHFAADLAGMTRRAFVAAHGGCHE